jgi:hypothetical protein
MNAKEELVEYLLSEDYLWLLERAILARYGTTTNHKEAHARAFELLEAYKETLE